MFAVTVHRSLLVAALVVASQLASQAGAAGAAACCGDCPEPGRACDSLLPAPCCEQAAPLRNDPAANASVAPPGLVSHPSTLVSGPASRSRSRPLLPPTQDRVALASVVLRL